MRVLHSRFYQAPTGYFFGLGQVHHVQQCWAYVGQPAVMAQLAAFEAFVENNQGDIANGVSSVRVVRAPIYHFLEIAVVSGDYCRTTHTPYLVEDPADTHIHRLAARWGLSDGKNVVKTEADLKKLFPEDTWIRRHLQIIYFGREHCPARGHDLSQCPICGWAASKKRIAEESRRR